MAEGFIGQRTAHGYPKWKVYIFGLDVTADIASVITNTSDVGRAPSTCEIVLSNLGDKYIITDEDIVSMYGDIDLAAVEAVVQAELAAKYTSGVTADGRTFISAPFGTAAALTDAAITAKVKERLVANVHIREKLLVLLAKVGERVKNIKTQSLAAALNGSRVTPAAIAAMTGDACRYPFQSGDCIFHSNDAVRVFLRDPLTLEWYFGFSGYLTDWVDSVDKDNKRIVTIRCEDVLRIFRYARIATNPGLIDAEMVRTNHDVLYRTFYTDSFAGLSLPEFLHLITFGLKATRLSAELRQRAGLQAGGAFGVEPSSTVRMGVEGDRTELEVSVDGIGSFNFEDSRIFSWGPPPTEFLSVPTGPEPPEQRTPRVSGKSIEPINSLGEYQAHVDHKVRLNDIAEMLVDDEKALAALGSDYIPQVEELSGEDAILKVIDIIGRHPGHYPVDFGRFIMLLPGCLGGDVSRDILDRGLIQSVASKNQFKTRLAMIYDICQRIEFSFYATPKGDILCEMPLYDFDPRDFGLEVIRPSASFGLGPFTHPLEEGFGPYGPRYTISMPETLSWERTFSDEQVRTQVRSQFFIAAGYRDIGSSDQVWQPPGVATLDVLLPQFGARLEDIDPQGPITTQTAAATYAHIKLNQLNANARTARVQAHIALGLGPNRPLFFAPRSQVMTLRTVTYSITWGKSGSVGMSLTTNYVRGWSGQLDDTGARVYEPIGGFASRPLNYAELFQKHQSTTSTKQLSVVASTPLTPEQQRSAEENLTKLENLVAHAMLVDPQTKLDNPFLYRENSGIRPFDPKNPKSQHPHGLALDIGARGIPTTRETAILLARRLVQWRNNGIFPKGTFIQVEDPSYTGPPTTVLDADGKNGVLLVQGGTGIHAHIQVPTFDSHVQTRTTPEDSSSP